AIFEGFARDHFIAADNAFRSPKIDDDIAIFNALDRAVDDLPDAVLVFVILTVPLSFPDLLHDDLLGGLGGDSAEVDRRQLLRDQVADLRVRIAHPRILK